MLISIDSGTRALGWAAWNEDGRLYTLDCSIARRALRTPDAQIEYHDLEIRARVSPFTGDVVVERMEWRKGDGRSVPGDLLRVQAVGFGVAGLLGGRVVSYTPGQWKGSIPKDVHHRRIREALTHEELAILDRTLQTIPRRHRKEALDAVGIGCYHLGRTTRSGARRQG